MKIKTIILLIIAAGFFTACSEWTDPENVAIDNLAKSENLEMYQQYLANLRRYKKTYHPLMVGWFDNSDKNFNSRGKHLSALPDSVDIVSLLYSEGLTEVESTEIAELQTQKGTKVIYTIDYPAAEKNFNKQIQAEIKAAAESGNTINEETRFDELLLEWIDHQLTFLNTYHLDGINFYYEGVAAAGIITPIQEYRLRSIQAVLFAKLQVVAQANPGKLFLFEGRPEYVFNDDPAVNLFDIFDYIVIRVFEAASFGEAEFIVNKAIKGITPSDRLIVATTPFSFDEDGITGVFLDSKRNILSAIVELGYWQPSTTIVKRGIGVYNINYDYYHADGDYKYTRQAISIMNP
jgi:hypothetical protein